MFAQHCQTGVEFTLCCEKPCVSWFRSSGTRASFVGVCGGGQDCSPIRPRILKYGTASARSALVRPWSSICTSANCQACWMSSMGGLICTSVWGGQMGKGMDRAQDALGLLYSHTVIIRSSSILVCVCCFSYKLLRPSVAVLHATDRVMGPEGNVCLAGCVSVGPHVQAGVAGVCVFSINTVLKHCA